MTVILDKTVRFLTNERSMLVKKRDGYLADMNRLAEAKDLINEQIAELDLVVEILSVGVKPDEPDTTPVKVSTGKSKMGQHQADIGAENRKWILDVINKHGAVTVQFLDDELPGVAKSTIYGHLKMMKEEGRVTRVRSKPNGGTGQSSYLYKIVPAVEFREHELDTTDNLVER